jgi:phosphoenolpyruvate carboxykinase (GTP)
VYQAFNWNHGVYIGATVGSETTAAAAGAIGQVRRDPMAMLPFCGYNMGDYFRHWLKMGKRLQKTPRIFHVNWFRKDASGKFLWPGFGENMRILKWVVERVRHGAPAKETPIGWVPRYEDIDWKGLDFPRATWDELMKIDRPAWKVQTLQHQELFLQLGESMPKELIFERENLISRC